MAPSPITHVALRFRERIWSLPRPYRHHHIIRMIVWLSDEYEKEDPIVTYVDAHGEDAGFLDASGQYLTRKQAHARAELTKQIKDPSKVTGTFTSEDLW